MNNKHLKPTSSIGSLPLSRFEAGQVEDAKVNNTYETFFDFLVENIQSLRGGLSSDTPKPACFDPWTVSDHFDFVKF